MWCKVADSLSGTCFIRLESLQLFKHLCKCAGGEKKDDEAVVQQMVDRCRIKFFFFNV